MSLDVNVRMQSIRAIEERSVSHPWMKMQMRFFWVWTKPLWASDLHSELSSVHGSMSSHYALCYPRLPRRFQTSSPYHVQSLFLFNATLSSLACSILKDCFKIASVSSENTVPRDAISFCSKLPLSVNVFTCCCWGKSFYCCCRFSTGVCYKMGIQFSCQLEF